MEKQPHEEYRDNLAKKLNEIRESDPENPEKAKGKAQGFLMASKETEKYTKSEKAHTIERVRRLPAEKRLPYFIEELGEEAEKYTKEELLKSLEAIDKAIENGIAFNHLDESYELYKYIGRIFEFSREYKNFELEDPDYYDLDGAFRALKEIFLPMEKMLLDVKEKSYGGTSLLEKVVIDRITISSGDPFGLTVAENKKPGINYEELRKERLRKFAGFINKFKLSPDQIAKKKAEIKEEK